MMSIANGQPSIEVDVKTARELSRFYPDEQKEVFTAVLTARLLTNSPGGFSQSADSSGRDAKPVAPAELFAKLKPAHDVTRILAAAFFLDRHRGAAEFAAEELKQCLVEAKVPSPKNPSLAALQNSRKGLMAQKQKAGRKISWYITLSGIQRIEQLLSEADGTSGKSHK
jgi:hypothetical protein